MIKKIIKTENQWRQILTPEQYQVMRQKQTERPFSCQLNQYKGEGFFHCAACDLPLFKSGVKFESGTGWPSFYEPVADNHLLYHQDLSLGIKRTEILCARCDSHLGHVFSDGPPPTGRRFCINGVALRFKANRHKTKDLP